MRIAYAQINCTLGAVKKNAEQIIDCAHRAQERRCDLVVFPELSLFGYWPSDLLERSELIQNQLKQIEYISKKLPENIAVLFGAVTLSQKKVNKFYKNSAILLKKNTSPRFFYKELLPNYDVFDEERHFAPGDVQKNIFKFKGKKILVTICEDIWGWGEAWVGTRYAQNPIKKLKAKDVDIIVNLSASPYAFDKLTRRNDVAQKTCKYLKAPMVYVNLVGGQDELVFDGGSFVMDDKGKILSHCVAFEEDLNVFDFATQEGGVRPQVLSKSERLRSALVLGIRDFVLKNNLKKVHLGLSGGVDSALVACLACDALGPGNVTTFALPGPHSSKKSFTLAKQLAQNLNCEFKEIDIKDSYQTVLNSFEDSLGKIEFGITQENLQARLRGVFLSAYSNLTKSLLLATSNKSEYAVGYATLYGDMCGGLAPIGDLLKYQVYEVCQEYNREHELIPNEILTREPSAELRPNQKDTDTLPEYKELDRIVHKLVVECKPPRGLLEKEIMQKIYYSEFKRWQAPPILRMSQHAFGTGRRFPITKNIS